MSEALDYPEVCDSVRRLCLQLPGDHWRSLDREREYPGEFVEALSQAGFLAVLIPEEYGDAGLPLAAAG